MKITMTGYKVKGAPEEAKKEILEALRKAEGSRPEAARLLGVGERGLYLWIQTLRMYDEIDALLRSMNLEVYGGPPRKYTKGSKAQFPKRARVK
jgi:hypothetical protein